MTFLNFIFQDPSPLISYSIDQWVEGTTNDTFFKNYAGGSFKRTSNAGATATLTFMGTSVTLFGAKRPNHGNYTVVLDDETPFVGNGNGDNIFQFPLWSAQNLQYAQHVVTMINIPTTQGNNLDIDFISIGREIGPSGYLGPIDNVTLDDESPFIMYNPPGAWSASSSLTAFNSSLHSTVAEGSSVSVFFQGSSVELYGLYVNAPFQANIDNQLPMNLAGPNVDLPTQEEHPQTLLFLADGLDENKTHVATLVNSVNDANRPLYFDYAIVRSSQSFFADTPSPDPNFSIPIPPSSSAAINSTRTSSSFTKATSSSVIVRQTVIQTGAIVGGVIGGVAGLTILASIGFILFTRSKCYQRTTVRATEYVNEDTSPAHAPVSEFISSIPTSLTFKSTTNLNSAAPSQQSHSIPTLSSSSGESSQVVSLPTMDTTENPQHRHYSILQTQLPREHDAGRLVEMLSLPPLYTDD